MNHPSFFSQIRQAPLLLRVCFFSFCFGAALAALAVTASAFYSYYEDRNQLISCLENRVDSSQAALSQAIQDQNRERLAITLGQINDACERYNFFDDVRTWRLMEASGDMVVLSDPQNLNHWHAQNFPVRALEANPMQKFWLGELGLRQGLDGLHAHHTSRALGLFLLIVGILAASAMLALFLGYLLIVRRARLFVDHIRRRNFDESNRSRIESEQTELSKLWQVVLELRDELEGKALLAEQSARENRVEKESARRQSEMKSQFLAKMSHELRTSMNGLLGFSTLLMESRLDDEQKEYAQTIQVSIESLLHVVNDVLDLSRIESGDLHISNIPFSFRTLVSGVAALLRKRAEAKGLRFETRISPDVPPLLRGDPVRIRQILINLVSNAIQHTERGHVLVNLESLQASEFDSTLQISIEDTGTEPEKRIRSDNQLASLGVSPFALELRDRRSVGMDVCYQLAELMEAELGFDGEPEKGSTAWFKLTLPTVRSTASTSPIKLENLAELRVLVIDSYEVSRKITLELLQEWGVEFRAVSTASDAIELLRQNEIDQGGVNLVLCDDLLQDLAGIEACRRIREIVPNQMSIVILCSNPQLGDGEGFFLAGANGFLSKQQRDPYLREVMCQVYEERKSGESSMSRLVTRYTIQDAIEQTPEAAPSEASHMGSVLVVEDNMVNQQLATRLLEKKGFHVDVATNGFEAIELFKANRYDLIFMDCLMPDMDGYETTQIIREIEKTRKLDSRTPIIALTAHAIEGEADRCFQVGMDEFVTKPFKLKQLEMVLERYIN